MNTIDYQTDPSRYRHGRIRFTVRPRESGDPGQHDMTCMRPWIPAFAGMSGKISRPVSSVDA